MTHMLPILALLTLQTGQLPQNAAFDYSGIPQLRVDATKVAVRSHAATLELDDRNVRVTTVTEIKNLTTQALTIPIVIPRRREGDAKSGPPTFGINANWSQRPLILRTALTGSAGIPDPSGAKNVFHYASDVTATVTLAPNATAGLRTDFTVPLGNAGFDRKMRATGYVLEGSHPVGQLNLSYRTRAGVVFRLPQPSPALGWQVGGSGAFTRQTNFVPGGQLTFVTFYPGGFGDIGG